MILFSSVNDRVGDEPILSCIHRGIIELLVKRLVDGSVVARSLHESVATNVLFGEFVSIDLAGESRLAGYRPRRRWQPASTVCGFQGRGVLKPFGCGDHA